MKETIYHRVARALMQQMHNHANHCGIIFFASDTVREPLRQAFRDLVDERPMFGYWKERWAPSSFCLELNSAGTCGRYAESFHYICTPQEWDTMEADEKQYLMETWGAICTSECDEYGNWCGTLFNLTLVPVG